MKFQEKLDKIVKKNNSLLCVGLDSDFEKIPPRFKKKKQPLFEFNKNIIDQTHDLVCAYKPNSAFYEALGLNGILALKFTCHYLQKNYPQIPIILDAKRGDIGSTNEAYAKFIFDFLGVDAVTIHPYLGMEANLPFLNRKDKGIIILCRTSNPGAGELQDLSASIHNITDDRRKSRNKESLYIHIAKKVVSEWNINGNCLLVVGATYPKELAEIRKLAGDMTFLVPGVGTQGGDVGKTVKAGLNSKKAGMIINSSRSIIFTDNPRSEAVKLREEINKYRLT